MEFIIALLTLVFLEIVLGVDNIIFVSIVTNRLPPEKQQKARVLGLSIALISRIVLLISLIWVLEHLTAPLFEIFDKQFSIREIVLLLGGVFLLTKTTTEIFHKMEGEEAENKQKKSDSMLKTILQITAIDIVFSFDSILTAVGLTKDLIVMIIAVSIAMLVMMIFASKISNFIAKFPSLELLALSFLILIGTMLVMEGLHVEVPKAYVYFAVFFSLIVEILNIKLRKKRNPVSINRKNRIEPPDSKP